MGSLRGMWGVPQRNSQFVGRDAELVRISTTLAASAAGKGDEGSGCLSTVEVVGMGKLGALPP